MRDWELVSCGHGSLPLRDRIQDIAHRAVNLAVRRGELPKASMLVCVDCGAPARDYDHRDYSKPLVVDPVCRPCNCRRGPAK